RTLVLGIPLAELVAEAEDALLRTRLLLVAAGPAEDGVVPALGDGAQQGRRLQAVARGPRCAVLDRAPGVDVVLDLGHHQPYPGGLGVAVPELEDLLEVAAGVDVQHRKGHGRGPERL